MIFEMLLSEVWIVPKLIAAKKQAFFDENLSKSVAQKNYGTPKGLFAYQRKL